MARIANSHNPLQLRRSALFVALAFPLAATAQTEAPKQLADVVVSASGFEQEIKEAPASITVIPRKELETKQFRDLAEALSDVEGVDVHGSTGKTGGLSISMRGMPSEYTLILIDGRRQNPIGDAAPNGFGSAFNSFMPPLAAIERIEIIRGPMSTLYGADAMGGVVNIITRKVAKEWHGAVGAELGVPQNDKFSTTQKINVYASGPIQEGVLGLTLRGSTTHRSSSERIIEEGTGRDPNPGKSRQHSFGTRLNLTPNTANEFWLDLDHAYTWYNNDDCRLGTRDYTTNCRPGGTSVSGYADYMELTRQQAAIGHKTRFANSVWESSLTYNVTETNGRTLPRNASTTNPPLISVDQIGDPRTLKSSNTILDSKLVMPAGDAHILTMGGQWWSADLKDGLLPKSTYSQSMLSFYLEDEWRFAKNFAATFGARYDEHDNFGGNLSPRAYLVWSTTPTWTIKGGISEGFKTPGINDLIDGAAGVGGQGSSLSIGNPNLKPETVRTKEISALYSNPTGLSASVTVFNNDFKDKILTGNNAGDCAINPISSCAANPTANYAINVDEAKTRGLELATRIPLSQQWSLSLNYTHTKSELIQDGVATGTLTNTPKHRGNVQLRWNPTEQLSLWLRGEYRGKSKRFGAYELTNFQQNGVDALGENLKEYGILHLGGSYKASKKVTLTANIFNLLDKDFTSGVKSYHSGNSGGQPTYTSGNAYFNGGSSISGVSHLGRTFWLSANMTF